MQIILHIGTDKTGSTAIQTCLPANRDWLLSRSVYLPTTGLGADNGHARVLEELDTGLLQELARELGQARTAGYARAIVSWEGMVRFNRGQIRRLADTLAGFEVRVLIYVRDQAEIIQSAHLQWIKMHANARSLGTLAEPATLRERIFAYAFLRDPRRNYYRTLRRWQRGLQRPTFSVRAFSKESLTGADVISDFIAQLDIDDNAGFVRTPERTNPSLDVESALLVQGWQRSPELRDELDTLIDVTHSLVRHEGARTRYFLDRRAVAAVRKHFQRSNRKLAERFMHGETLPFPNSSKCWREESFAAIEARSHVLAMRVREVNDVPTLGGAASGTQLSGKVQLYAGWSAPEDWGVWSIGPRSCLRFRLHHRLLAGGHTRIRLGLRGRYHEGISSSGVQINGIDIGPVDLSDAQQSISIAVSELLPFEVVELCLTHTLPPASTHPAAGEDRRPLAFALSEIIPLPEREPAGATTAP